MIKSKAASGLDIIERDLAEALARVDALQAVRLKAIADADAAEGWRPLAEAPRDGSWIEIREKREGEDVDYSVIARWVDYEPPGSSLRIRRCGWRTIRGGGFVSDGWLTWRPAQTTSCHQLKNPTQCVT